jgi:hypothetical protein
MGVSGITEREVKMLLKALIPVEEGRCGVFE